LVTSAVTVNSLAPSAPIVGSRGVLPAPSVFTASVANVFI